MADDFSHIYRWNRRGRKGQRCKVTARGSEVRHGHPRHEIIEPEELAELGVAFDAWAAVSTPAGGRQDNPQGGGQKTAFADGTGAAINDFYFAMPKVILIVDDEPLIRIQIREILEKEGFAVKEAANVHQALQLLDEDGISAVLTDIVCYWRAVQRAVLRNGSGRKPLKARIELSAQWRLAPRQRALLRRNLAEETHKQRAAELLRRRSAVAQWQGLTRLPARDCIKVLVCEFLALTLSGCVSTSRDPHSQPLSTRPASLSAMSISASANRLQVRQPKRSALPPWERLRLFSSAYLPPGVPHSGGHHRHNNIPLAAATIP